ncbi:thermonuclease family protein [Nocardia sp. CA-084685]|uniref:thermonuclease family protein n=1 Tax=Nocardia sp. CA-084685 TaxID=3239970 RepID=UPI003D95665B
MVVVPLTAGCGQAPGVGSASPAAAAPSPIPVPADAEGPFPVSRVVDGDTVSIQKDGKQVKVRMVGLDTPETWDPHKAAQCFGVEASNHAKQVLTGKQVLVKPDSSQDSTDKYGRLLAYVWVDGALFNLDQIAQGFGHAYTYQTPYQYQREFRAAERHARDNQLGLWNPATCNGVTQ